MDKYHHVALEVEPKRKALKESQEELDVLTHNLNKLRSTLKEVEDKINELERKYNESVAKKEELAAKVKPPLQPNTAAAVATFACATPT